MEEFGGHTPRAACQLGGRRISDWLHRGGWEVGLGHGVRRAGGRSEDGCQRSAVSSDSAGENEYEKENENDCGGGRSGNTESSRSADTEAQRGRQWISLNRMEDAGAPGLRAPQCSVVACRLGTVGFVLKAQGEHWLTKNGNLMVL